MEWCFASFDNLWALRAKAVGTAIPNRKKMSKETFSVKLKKGERLSAWRDHLLVTKWCDMREIFGLSTVHNDMLESREAREKNKPVAVINIKLVWTNPTSCWRIILFKESQSNGGRISCFISLTFPLWLSIFYIEIQADRIFGCTVL